MVFFGFKFGMIKKLFVELLWFFHLCLLNNVRVSRGVAAMHCAVYCVFGDAYTMVLTVEHIFYSCAKKNMKTVRNNNPPNL